MDATDRRPVIAATDFSPDGNAAARYAADLAAGLNRPLAVLHVAPVLTPVGPTIMSGAAIRSRLRRARVGVAALVETVIRDHPGVAVTSSIAAGDPVDTLLNRCVHAFALVIGARGLGGYPTLRWGSVSNRVVSRACCPAVIVHADERGDPPRADGPIVVVGGPDDAATRFATDALRPGPSYTITVDPDTRIHDIDLSRGGLPTGRMIIRIAARPDGLVATTAHIAGEFGARLVVVPRNRHAWPFRFGVGSAVHDLVDRVDCPLAVVEATGPPAHPSPASQPAIAEA